MSFAVNNSLARYRAVDMECINDSLNEWRPEGKGCDWETDATICTVSVSANYSLDNASGRVKSINCGWGMVAGSLAVEDVRSVYIDAVGGIDNSECWEGEEERLM
eukprot:scaffold134690_cov20-Prasinocladus_malaysianus.AAC.1